MIVWRVDDVGVLRGRFLSPAGALADPTEVTVQVRTPSGSTFAYTYSDDAVTRDSLGNYSRPVTFDEAGMWAYAITGSGVVDKTEEGSVRVVPSDYGL